jgi:hypothetical protein
MSDSDYVNISMDVDAMDISVPALSTKLTPRYEIVGLESSVKNTEVAATVTARELPEDDESTRAPVDIVVALDISGSMSGRKLDLCKETLALLLRELGAQDRFGLVTFENDAQVVISPRKMTKETKENAVAKIKNIRATGCTNLSGGIGLAAQELQAIESPHEVRTIFVLTDGHANRGISDKAGIVNLTKGCLGGTGSKREIAIHCFGYGSDHDVEMLGDISKATEGGSYYFVDKDSDVSTAFGDALGGVLSVVAQNVCIKIQVPDESIVKGVTIRNVKHEKATKDMVDGSYKVMLGDFYAEESRDVIIDIDLANENGGLETVPHLSASLTYLDTINKKLVNNPMVTCSIARPNSDELSKADKHVALQCMRLNTVKVLTDATNFADAGNLSEARKLINKYIALVKEEAKILQATEDPVVVQTLLELNTTLSGLSTQIEYHSFGKGYATKSAHQQSYQRCNESTEEAPNVFRSPKKGAMLRRMQMFK